MVDLNGCTDETSVSITITPQPELNPVPPQMDCDQFDLSSVAVTDANGTDLSGASYTYHQDNGGLVGNAISPIVTVSGFYWTVVELNGCSGSVRYQVTVNESPTADISGNTQLCNGGSTSLDAGPGYAQYQWSPGGQTSQTITVSDAGTYNVTVTDGSGCSDATSINVIVANELSPSITGNDQFCDGESSVLNAGSYDTYIWSPGGQTSQTVTVTTDGTYSVTVTDISGCTGSDSFSVTQAAPISPSISGDTQLCTGESTTLSTSGFLQYVWSPGGETTNFIIADAAGDYAVTVTDQYGCTGSASVSVTQSSQVSTSISGDNTICFGESATLAAEAGFAQYTWSPGGATTQTITTSIGATYNVTVTDLGGCTGTASTTVSQTPQIQPEISGDEQVCVGENAQLEATPGFAAYAWSPGGATAQIINPSVVGPYNVTVTDGNGCTGTAGFVLNGSPAPTPVIAGNDNICAGQSAFLDAGIYSEYIWGPNGETSQSIEAVQAGSYTVTVTDGLGCTGTASHSLLEIQPTNPAISGILERCVGGSTTLTAESGFSLYSWSPGGQTSTSITVSTDGVYTVTALDANGCLGSSSVTVVEIPEPTPNISGTDPFCPGTESLLTADPGYDHYQWSIGGTNQTRTISVQGTYSVTVTDANGCSGSAEVFVATTPLPNPSIFGDTEFCAGSSASISVGAGLPGYEWSTGDVGTTVTVTAPGQYCITVTNANGCTGSGCRDIAEIPLPEPVINGELIICNGNPTTLDVDANFDSYVWSGGETINEITASVAGTYCVTVTNVNGCEGSACVDVTENSILEPTISGNLAICSGAETTLSVAAGFTEYEWSSGEAINEITASTAADYCVTVTDANGCTGSACATVTNNDNPTPTITGNAAICGGASTVLGTSQTYASYQWSDGTDQGEMTVTDAGNYCVTVTDSGGCTGSNCIDVVILPPILAGITGDSQICEGETSTLTADGGFSAYQWDNTETTAEITVSAANTYCVTVTDVDGCTTSACADVLVNENPTVAIAGELEFCEDASTTLTADAGFDGYAWTGGGTGQSETFNTSGNYCVTVTDVNGCTASECVELVANPLPQPEIDGELDFCEGGSTILGLTESYETYEWSDATNGSETTITAAGNYCVTVTDANGCTASACADVVENPLPQPSISGNLQPCEGESTTLSADAGFDSYVWGNGSTTSSITVSDAGTYCVTVTDGNGCEGSTCADVSLSPLPEPAISGETAFCEGESTTLNATAGFDAYAWSSGEGVQTITATASGNYTVTVTDGNGCTGTANLSVVENPNPQPSITGSLSFCVGGTTTLQAGQTYAQYEWSTSEATASITVGIADTYCLTVTDDNGCTGSTCVSISEQAELTPVIGGGGNLCEGETANLNAGAGFATYEWSNGITDQIAPVTDANTYCVTVSDAGGCTGTACTDVSIVALPITVITGDLALCGGSNGTLSAGSGYAGYEWSNGGQTDVIIIDAADTYCVTITDANGCTASTCADVTISPDLEPAIVGEPEFCNGSSSLISVSGTYTSYNWSTGDTDANLNVTTAGEYCVTVSNASGCSGFACMELTETSSVDVGINGDLSFCFETDATLEADPGFVTYEWSNGTFNQSLNVANPNTYCVTVTDANGCTGATCVDVVEQAEVLPNITGSLAFCAGGSTSLNAGGGYQTYLWTGGGTSQNLTVTANGNYCVTVTDANGCSGTDCVDVTEEAGLAPDISGLLDICEGGSTELQASPGFDQYLWGGSETTDAVTVTDAGTYCVTVTDVSGCSGTVCAEVAVQALPEAPAAASPPAYCEGEAIEALTASGSGGDMTWYESSTLDVAISVGGSLLPATPAVNTTVSYWVTETVNGCEGPATEVQLSVVDCNCDIPADPTPLVDSLLVCAGETNASAFSVESAAGTEVYWYSSASSTEVLGTGLAFVPTAAGVYYAEARNVPEDGCASNRLPFTLEVDIVGVDITSNPSEPIIVESGEAVSLEVLGSSSHGSIISYGWVTSDPASGLCDSCAAQSLAPTVSSGYTVTVTDDVGCTATDLVNIELVGERVVMIPNAFSPNDDNTNEVFTIHGENIATVEYHIYNRWGQEIYSTVTNDLNIGWDGTFKGKDMEVGVYVFYVYVTFVDGGAETFKGNLTLIR